MNIPLLHQTTVEIERNEFAIESQKSNDGTERKTYLITISGRVQGVGYRNYCMSVARKVNLNGSVRNLRSGKVEILANLTLHEKRYLERELRLGTVGSQVLSVVSKEVEFAKFQGFRVVL